MDSTQLEILKGLRRFGTERQKAFVDAVIKHETYEAAAEALGVKRQAVWRSIHRLKRKAARQGWAPDHDMTATTPDGFHVRGTSTLYRKDPRTGEKTEVMQWVKTGSDKDEDRLQALLDAIEPLAHDVAGKSTFVPAPEVANEDLLTVYPMGDPHIGMYAWATETGDRNFDLGIAKNNLLAAVNRLVDLAPPSKTAIMLNLGDFFHADSGRNTTTLGTPQDVDGRIAKVLHTGVAIMVESITAALSKHERVLVYCLLGNHDDLMAVVLAVCLQHHFNNNPRVVVETAPRQHHYYEFGANLIGMHHGHATKPQMLPAVMAADQPQAWGRTLYRRWYCGHIHHDTVKEWPGCAVETFRTLAPRDAWTASKGYRSGNDMKLDVWHRRWGHINRHIVGIEAILAEAGE